MDRRKSTAQEAQAYNPRGLSFKKLLFYISTAFIIFGIALLVYFLFFCKVNTLQIENNFIYSKKDIIDSANIKMGTHTYAIDKEAIESSIKSKCPAIKDVTIRRKFPSTLRIILQEESTLFYIKASDEYIVFTPSLYVIELTDDEEYLDEKGYIEAVLSSMSRAVVGNYMEFSEDGAFEHYKHLCTSISESKLLGEINKADLSNKYAIKLFKGSIYTFNIGNYADIEDKLDLSSQILTYAKNAYPEKSGTIYITSDKKGSFLPK